MLRHPMYAGTYVYGRCPMDPKRRVNRNGKPARKWVSHDEWKVMIHDRVPAYITWEQFEANQERMRQNASRWNSYGFPTIAPGKRWDKSMVLALLRRSELLPGRTEKIELAPDEWLLADLARETGIGCGQIRRWMK